GATSTAIGSLPASFAHRSSGPSAFPYIGQRAAGADRCPSMPEVTRTPTAWPRSMPNGNARAQIVEHPARQGAMCRATRPHMKIASHAGEAGLMPPRGPTIEPKGLLAGRGGGKVSFLWYLHQVTRIWRKWLAKRGRHSNLCRGHTSEPCS